MTRKKERKRKTFVINLIDPKVSLDFLYCTCVSAFTFSLQCYACSWEQKSEYLHTLGGHPILTHSCGPKAQGVRRELIVAATQPPSSSSPSPSFVRVGAKRKGEKRRKVIRKKKKA